MQQSDGSIQEALLRYTPYPKVKNFMLSSQRELFDIPGDVCFLNAASYSPLPLAIVDAGRKAVARKGRPWLVDHEFASKQYERARNAAARLINADPEDVALISSVGYGVAAADRHCRLSSYLRGSRASRPCAA
jgi:selenocysteine lyase/cysteine desulfurase